MHVVATAGHVDHGKSTLVRALTGMEPDRWAEERRRGMTIDLGYAWTRLPTGEQVAFVDVPGHERFVPNMLAGIGPVPAVLVVVAADEGWRAQSEEHLSALDALGVRHGLLVVTRSDLADPGPATDDALKRIRRTSLGDVPAVAVSAVTGAGLDALREALTRLVSALPAPDPRAPVRLWVDRSFTISGAGTVVTGTLPAGTLHGGDELVLAPAGNRVHVRGLQSLGEPQREVSGVARVAVNLRGVAHDDVHRGDSLITPGAWHLTREIDVRLARSRMAGAAGRATADANLGAGGDAIGGARPRDLPEQLVLHVGSAAVTARLRPLVAGDAAGAGGGDSPAAAGGETLRLQLPVALPLHVGDRGLLRDPGLHVVVGAITVLDVAPPALRRRGAAAARARELAGMTGRPDAADEIRRRGMVSADALRAMGVAPPDVAHRGWYVDAALRQRLATQLGELVTTWAAAHPLEPGLPVEAARQRLRLPDPALVDLLRRDAGLQAQEGRLRAAGAREQLPPRLESALQSLGQDLRTTPFAAPEAARLAQLGLGPREVAAAVKAGRLLKVADNVVLLAGADVQAAQTLAGLGGPFTVSEARQALGSTRRVVVPLLELLDRRGLTDRLPDDRRVVRASRSA